MDPDLRIPKLRSFLTLLHDIFISIQGLLSIETGLSTYHILSFRKQCLWLRLWQKGHHPQRAYGSLPSECPILCPSGQLHHDFYCCLLFLCLLSLCISVSTSFSPPKILSSMKAEIAFLSHARLPVPTILPSIQQSYGNNYSYLCVFNKWECYDNKCWDGGHTRTCSGHMITEVLQSLISLRLSIFPKAPP